MIVSMSPDQQKLRMESSVQWKKIQRGAFSLTEVVIALGIFVFALVAILGLMPMGLKLSADSREEARAMQTLAALAASIRAAATTDQTNYTAAPPFSNISWSRGGIRSNTTFYFTEQSQIADSANEEGVREIVFISIVPPPAGGYGVGTAYIGVAFPGRGTQISSWKAPENPRLAAAPDLVREAGYVSTCVIFEPES